MSSGITSPVTLLHMSSFAFAFSSSYLPSSPVVAQEDARVQRKGIVCVLTIEMQQGAWHDLMSGGEPAGLFKILVLNQQGDYILFNKLALHSETL